MVDGTRWVAWSVGTLTPLPSPDARSLSVWSQTLKVTAQGYQERVFGKLMIGTGRNPAMKFATLPSGSMMTSRSRVAEVVVMVQPRTMSIYRSMSS